MAVSERGSATVEHVGLAALIALILGAAVALVAANPPGDSARRLGGSIARRLACAPRHPVPCGRNPLALAYGFPVGKLVRDLAPPLGALDDRGLLPVDFRLCRTSGCARPGDRPGLTAAGRRVTLFTSVEDLRTTDNGVRVTYWAYRPTLRWASSLHIGGPADVAAASAIRLDLRDDPALVPLELLAGRNHHRFAPSEQPPWRWRIEPAYPG